MDWPATFYAQMVETWPDAPVLLSNGATQNWYASCANSIHAAKEMALRTSSKGGDEEAPSPEVLKMINDLIWNGVPRSLPREGLRARRVPSPQRGGAEQGAGRSPTRLGGEGGLGADLPLPGRRSARHPIPTSERHRLVPDHVRDAGARDLLPAPAPQKGRDRTSAHMSSSSHIPVGGDRSRRRAAACPSRSNASRRGGARTPRDVVPPKPRCSPCWGSKGTSSPSGSSRAAE